MQQLQILSKAMIIVDTKLAELAAANTPIRVGLIGAGFMAKGAAVQLLKYTQGMQLVGIANRTTTKALDLFTICGKLDVKIAESQVEFDSRAEQDLPSVVEDPMILCRSKFVDVIVELTGSIEYSALAIMEAIAYKKHIVVMNAELDGTIGPIIKQKADQAGVIYTNAAGDQPGVEMNLYRFVKGMGLTPVVCGNIKGLQDPYRTPTTQKAFAEKWGQNPSMVTSFADGTKISFEQAVVANATGMRVAKRGMHGYDMAGQPIENTSQIFNFEELQKGGIVDYVVGAQPNGGVFVLATIDDPIQKHYLDLYKVGKGPLYCFYVPYHLCHFELPMTIARAVLYRDATIAPLDKPMVDVIAVAKRDLQKGETIDYMGGYTVYGVAENWDTSQKEALLPIGLSEGLQLNKFKPKDTAITLADVALPEDKLSVKLWREQNKIFS